MSFQTHPMVMRHVAALRHADLLAEADRERLAQRAATGANPRPRWADLSAVLAVVLALMLTR
jgi:hypothetical protein